MTAAEKEYGGALFALASEENLLDEVAQGRRAALAAIRENPEYLKLVENLENDEVFKKSSVKVWYCRNCGHLEYGDQAPEVCPVCSHPQAFFEIKADNY